MSKILSLITILLILMIAVIGCDTGMKKVNVNVSTDVGQVIPSETNMTQGVTNADNTADTEEVYYLIGMHIILPYWQDHRRGLEAAAAELNVRVVFTGENGNDASRQEELFEQIILKKPAGILISPIDPQMMINPINKAISMGIPVICIDTDSPQSNRLTYLGTDNYNSGYQAADILAKTIGMYGNVGILTIPGIFSLDERQRGFEECIKEKYPDIKIVSVMNDNADPSKAASVTAQMLKAAPSIKGIFGTDAASGVGAAIALQDVSMLGQVKIVAFDKDSSVLDLVEQGIIEATLVQRTFTMSYYGLKYLYDYNHGNLNMASDMTGINPLPQWVDTGIIVVRKEDVYKFR